MNINSIFDYLGIDEDNREGLREDMVFMEEIMRVHEYATIHGMEYCLYGDEFRFSHTHIEIVGEFTIFMPLY